MSLSLRNLFWITAFAAIYSAAFARLGLMPTIGCGIISLYLVWFASWFFRGPKYDDDVTLGWMIILGCLAIPVILLGYYQ